MTKVTASKALLTFKAGESMINVKKFKLVLWWIHTARSLREMKRALVTGLTGSVLAMQAHELLHGTQQKRMRLRRHYLVLILCLNASAVLAMPPVASVTGCCISTEPLGFCSRPLRI